MPARRNCLVSVNRCIPVHPLAWLRLTHKKKRRWHQCFHQGWARRLLVHFPAWLWLIATASAPGSCYAQHNRHKYQCFLHKTWVTHEGKTHGAAIMPATTDMNINEFPTACKQHIDKRAQKAKIFPPKPGDMPLGASPAQLRLIATVGTTNSHNAQHSRQKCQWISPNTREVMIW